jgi:hypothetical protein
VEKLRLKPKEAVLNPPSISLLQAPSPGEAARQMREAFPAADGLHEITQVIVSTTADKIRVLREEPGESLSVADGMQPMLLTWFRPPTAAEA